MLSFALGGLSKSVGLPQVKLGWIAVGGPDALVTAALDRLELICDTYLSVSTPVQVGGRRPARARRRRPRADRRARRDELSMRCSVAVAAAPSCGVLRSDGGWYAVMQVPSLESEEDLVVDLLTTDGVLVHPGYFFDFPRESFLVVSLLAAGGVVRDGVGARPAALRLQRRDRRMSRV